MLISVTYIVRKEKEEPQTTETTNSVQFKVLMKKGNKQVAKNLDVPVDSQIASATIAKKTMAREEQEDIKRLVLQYEEREETDQGLESPDGGTCLRNKIEGFRLPYKYSSSERKGKGWQCQ